MARLPESIEVKLADLPEVREMLTRADSEIARLRGLIKEAEWANTEHEPEGACPWCEHLRELYRYGNGKPVPETGGHADDCPAFTPDGAVR